MATAATSNIGCLVLSGSTGVKITSITGTLFALPATIATGEGIVNYVKSGITGATFSTSYLDGCTFNTLSGTTFRTNHIDALTSGGVTMFNSVATSISMGQSATSLSLLSSNLGMPNRPFFFATANTQSNVTGAGTNYTILYANVSQNVGGAYNSGNGTFTAPYTGVYNFSYLIETSGIQGGTHLSLQTFFFVGGLTAMYAITNATLLNGAQGIQNGGIIHLASGTTVTTQLTVASGPGTVSVATPSTFSGIFLG